MKVDIDELERVVREMNPGVGPETTLALIGRIRRLEMELARASGVARAKGEDAYADDFMRVAQDREDFDAEILEKAVQR